ncbi:MAG: PotD/PotF family extracellular solute-binding protein [Anaerovoracaceae bacterium]
MKNSIIESVKKNLGRAAVLCLCAAVLFNIPVVYTFADDNENGYDTEYYSRFKDDDISINVYNWGEYISNGEDGLMDINAEFEKLTGITVNYSNYETNEGMYAKLKSGANSYDVIFPSDYMVSRMIQENMLQQLDFNNIPNMKYIGKEFLNPEYDPENLYSVPYTWGRVAIIYNKKLIGHEINDIAELWNPEYSGKILMFKNSRDAFALALERLGYSLNTENKSELDEAAELLKQQKPLVQAYVMDQIFDKMQGNEAWIAPYYVGDYYIMKEVNPDLEVYIPENTNIYYDAACIPTCAKEKEAAEMYINFLNEPQVAADNAEFIMYSTPNMAAKELLDEEISENPDFYPSEEELEGTVPFINLSEETNLYIDQLWTDILSSDAAYLDWVMPVFVVLSVLVIAFNSYRKRKKKKKDLDIL